MYSRRGSSDTSFRPDVPDCPGDETEMPSSLISEPRQFANQPRTGTSRQPNGETSPIQQHYFQNMHHVLLPGHKPRFYGSRPRVFEYRRQTVTQRQIFAAKRLTGSTDQQSCGDVCISSSDGCCGLDDSCYCRSGYTCGYGGNGCNGNSTSCSLIETFVYWKSLFEPILDGKWREGGAKP